MKIIWFLYAINLSASMERWFSPTPDWNKNLSNKIWETGSKFKLNEIESYFKSISGERVRDVVMTQEGRNEIGT